MAQLAYGFLLFLDFAQDAGVLPAEERESNGAGIDTYRYEELGEFVGWAARADVEEVAA